MRKLNLGDIEPVPWDQEVNAMAIAELQAVRILGLQFTQRSVLFSQEELAEARNRYEQTVMWAERFEREADAVLLEEPGDGTDPLIIQALHDAYQSQAATLRQQAASMTLGRSLLGTPPP